MRNKIRLSNICKIGCPLTWKVGKSTKKCSFIHYSFHAYDLHVRARPFSKALLKREQEQKLGQNIFEVAIRLSKCASQNGKFYIESKVGIFNIFVVLSNIVCSVKNHTKRSSVLWLSYRFWGILISYCKFVMPKALKWDRVGLCNSIFHKNIHKDT